MLVLVPLAVASHFLGWGDTAVFVLNFLAMMPLASLLGEFTEEVAMHTNQTIGGLINATFGNAVEVVVALQALHAGQIRVVQASLMGSVFSNMLLVLGCCFFFGGLRYKEQRFNSTSAVANMSLLLLSSLALVLPTPLAQSHEDGNVLLISRFAGICLLFMYVQLMFFQLKTHSHLYGDEDEVRSELSMPGACIGLLTVTLAVAYLSELLVDSIDGFTEQAHLSKTFVGLILLPIIGNAVEHVTAVTVAMKDKMELAMGVAVGSATQISMLVTPIVVLAGWAMGQDMTLAFPVEEVVLYFLSVIIVTTAATAGSSNWLLGSLLVTTYVLVSLAFWYEKVDGDDA
ncbi:Sodium/calcium exchanger protein-domain-containing protein [Tribonema minus]|uniref:Sodium/calcium exchanger protein-domain-containing protein n=1 Tax=Tribonema minus TaxID=303371 RepID=A0A835ZBG0_9STRA|nr:Sodium/calcium exchanger protein-domain-containing protein [Tribonema minus]